MRQQLDIADVEARTKIRAKYLRALENEEFGMLPGPTFVKTFLRTYAEMLGLDPYRLVEEYRSYYERREEAEPVGRSERRRRPQMRQPGPIAALALLGLVVVGALAVVGVVFGGDDDGDGDSEEQQPAQTAPREQERERPARPRRVRLRIAPVTPTYVCIDRGADTPIVFEGTLDAPRTFRGRILRVNLGKTDVQLGANGRPIAVEPGPEPVGFRFTARSHRSLPPAKRPCV